MCHTFLLLKDIYIYILFYAGPYLRQTDTWFAMTARAESMLCCLAEQNDGQKLQKTDLLSGVWDVRVWNV